MDAWCGWRRRPNNLLISVSLGITPSSKFWDGLLATSGMVDKHRYEIQQKLCNKVYKI